MVQLDAAIDFLKENCDFQIVPNTTWADGDFERFTELTGLIVPTQLAEVFRQYGQCGTEYNDNFSVQNDGSRSIHDIQVLVSNFDTIVSRHEMFISKSIWDDQFIIPMIFFGSADSGHSYLLADGKNVENNAVYFWERATDPFGTGNNARGIAKVADTLYEFFYNLKPREDL